MTRVRIEIERYTPKLKGMKGRNMRGNDGRFMVIHEDSEANALAEIRSLRNAGAFDAPYNFKEAKLFDADKFDAWVKGFPHYELGGKMPKPFKIVTTP